MLSGVSCPRGERTMPGGVVSEGEPFGNEATAFIKDQIMQKEVEIEVETMDKGKCYCKTQSFPTAAKLNKNIPM